MNVISENTASDAGLIAPDKLACPRQETGRQVTRLTARAFHRATVVRSREGQRIAGTPRRLAAQTATSETFKAPWCTGNQAKPCPKAPLSQLPGSATSSLYYSARAVCHLSLVEQAAHAIIAISAVFAAGGALYWVAKLVSQWALFGAGIDKLIQ